MMILKNVNSLREKYTQNKLKLIISFLEVCVAYTVIVIFIYLIVYIRSKTIREDS